MLWECIFYHDIIRIDTTWVFYDVVVVKCFTWGEIDWGRLGISSRIDFFRVLLNREIWPIRITGRVARSTASVLSICFTFP